MMNDLDNNYLNYKLKDIEKIDLHRFEITQSEIVSLLFIMKNILENKKF